MPSFIFSQKFEILSKCVENVHFNYSKKQFDT